MYQRELVLTHVDFPGCYTGSGLPSGPVRTAFDVVWNEADLANSGLAPGVLVEAYERETGTKLYSESIRLASSLAATSRDTSSLPGGVSLVDKAFTLVFTALGGYPITVSVRRENW